MNALSAALDGLQDRILRGDGAIFARVRGADAGQRLRIYADAYRLRLAEVLGNDFPATRNALGEAAFEGVAERYLRAHWQPGDLVLTMGCGNIDQLNEQMHEHEARRATQEG